MSRASYKLTLCSFIQSPYMCFLCNIVQANTLYFHNGNRMGFL